MAYRDGRHPVQIWLVEDDWRRLSHWAIENDTTVGRWLLDVAVDKAAKLSKKDRAKK